MDWGEKLDNLAYAMVSGGTSLHEWATELSEYCGKVVARYGRKPAVQSIAKTVQDYFTAPINSENLQRYQAALDGELYKAIEALRKQQEYRHKLGITVEAEIS